MIKLCTKCGIGKPVFEFGRRQLSSDGRQIWCRDCRREYQRAYAQNFRDPEKHREAQRRYRLRHAEKHQAHSIVRSAVKACRIVVAVWCQRCGCVTDLEAHHHDYSKPLSVEWLCSTCHGLAHRSYEGGQHAGL